MELLYFYKEGKNYQKIVGPGNCRYLKFLDFSLLSLKKGEEFEKHSKGRETGLVILGGKCSVKIKNKIFKKIGERKDVFSGKATAFYIPSGITYKIKADTDVEIAIFSAPSKKKETEPVLITPSDVKVKKVGRGNFEREVHDIIVENLEITPEYLLVGETFNPPGNWSSYPPHKHDEEKLPFENSLEEIYHYRVFPAQGFGLQRIYTKNRKFEKVYVVENKTTVVIPFGYHPVVAAPGYSLYYLWGLAGEKRVMKPNDDPLHKWVKNE